MESAEYKWHLNGVPNFFSPSFRAYVQGKVEKFTLWMSLSFHTGAQPFSVSTMRKLLESDEKKRDSLDADDVDKAE